MSRILVEFPASTRPGAQVSQEVQHGPTYTHAAALRAAKKVLQPQGWTVKEGSTLAGSPEQHDFDVYFCDYDLIPFEKLLSAPSTSAAGRQAQCSSYVIRKALIRKHYLAHALHLHSVKNDMKGKQRSAEECTPKTWHFEVQFADDLDELFIDDLYDLHEILQRQEDPSSRESPSHQWFILKPGMSDRGNGIQIFDNEERLRSIFQELEDASLSEDGDHDEDEGGETMLGQLRHFVIQEYIKQPLVIDPQKGKQFSGRKFHLRAYVLCVGGLSVYLLDDMLALFAPLPYESPSRTAERQYEDSGAEVDLRAHLTNTCLRTSEKGDYVQETIDENVFVWRSLSGCAIGGGQVLSQELIDQVERQAATVVGQVFEACAKAGSVHWQMWPNAWEIFGVDLLVGWDGDARSAENLQSWLLEINAQPDFKQTGTRLERVVDHLFERSLEIAVLRKDARAQPWKVGEGVDGMTLCFHEDLIRS